MLLLTQPHSIAAIGSDAGPGKNGPHTLTKLETMAFLLWAGVWGKFYQIFPRLGSEEVVKNRQLPLPGYPFGCSQGSRFLDGTNVMSCLDDWGVKKAAKAATGQVVTLVFINSDSGKDYITVDGNEGDR